MSDLFTPSVARAKQYRRDMDEALWTSAGELVARLCEADGPAGRSIADTSRVDFRDYAAYFDVALFDSASVSIPVDAYQAGLERLRRRVSNAPVNDTDARPPRLTNFSARDYNQHELDQLTRWLDLEPANRMAMTRATEEEVRAAHQTIQAALDHLRVAAPEMYGETLTIIRDIILSRPDGTNLMVYSGASSFPLWGAITINVESNHIWVQFYRQIVHEEAHNLLFSIAREQPLVISDPAERRPSPIRADPRPLDGLYHAVFVSAREAFALEALLLRHEKGMHLEGEDISAVEDLLQLSVLAFSDGLETLRAEAGITPLGQDILDDCERYMNSNFSIRAV